MSPKPSVLATIVSGLLSLPRVGLDENLLDLGPKWSARSVRVQHGWSDPSSGALTESGAEEVARAQREGTPVCLLAITSALVAFFDWCEAHGRQFALPGGSRIMDTGGNKGIGRPISRHGFLHSCWKYLKVAGYSCVNEYGMTEMAQMMPRCQCMRYHRPPGLIWLLLDANGERLLGPEGGPGGVVEGRFGFLDLIYEGRWGGLITG
jgi:hypothetical protein